MTLDPRLTTTHLLALTLWGEVRSASLEELIAMGCLIRNQVRLGERYQDICLAYPCWQDDASGNHAKLLDVMQQLLDGTVSDPRYHEASWVAVGMLGGYCRDVLKGATKAHPVLETPRPEWARERIPTLTYARHVFYSDSAATA